MTKYVIYSYAGFLQRAEKPRWGGMYWDASYFRPACPQNLDEIRLDIPDYPSANVSEDCLYMNIFAPNVSALHMRGRGYICLMSICIEMAVTSHKFQFFQYMYMYVYVCILGL